MTIKKCLPVKIVFLLFILFVQIVQSQNKADVISFSQYNETNNYRWQPDSWRYTNTDDPTYPAFDFKDSTWEKVSSSLIEDNLPKSGWQGEGWFRLNVNIDSSLVNKPLALTVYHGGEVEVFLNGSKIYAASIQNMETDFKIFSFTQSGNNLFAVRYINMDFQKYFNAGFMSGFIFNFGPADRQISDGIKFIRSNELQKNFFTALTLGFALLHLILFLFSRNIKSNLYFTVFLFLYALNIYFDYQNFLSINLDQHLTNLRWHRAVLPLTQIVVLRFIYSLFYEKIPKQFWVISAIIIIAGVFAVAKPTEYFSYFQIVIIILIGEIFRVLNVAVKKKTNGVWLIASGFLILFVFSSYDLFVDLNLIEQYGDISNGYVFGLIGLFISMSTYLARDFAKRNEKIIEQDLIVKEQEIQQKILEKDNERKTSELDEARKIQLSMLPSCMNDFKGLDICFDMRTATEVGGDYYDYIVARDGTLNIAIGDATGHGAKAGLMVASIKSLFSALGTNLIITDFFHRCTEIIKNMKLGNLFMSMTLLRLKNNNFILSTAGMPPVFIYRKSTNDVEEILIKSMPIGAVANFPYQLREGELESGDIILMMSDGFPELFNEEREMLGYERIKKYLIESAEHSASSISQRLFKYAEQWSGIYAQNDDITFVIIKILNEVKNL
ncbi:MAG: SpoIIE family protein phosphatase [bacterium]